VKPPNPYTILLGNVIWILIEIALIPEYILVFFMAFGAVLIGFALLLIKETVKLFSFKE
jgi:hypothetical protein